MIIALVIVLFCVTFPAIWLLVTSVLGALSGWFDLQTRFPDRIEPVIERLDNRSAVMGMGINIGFALTLEACPGGLRFSILRLLGPFQKPFLVPWDEISAKRRSLLFFDGVSLSLGKERPGRILISAKAFQRIAAVSPLAIS